MRISFLFILLDFVVYVYFVSTYSIGFCSVCVFRFTSYIQRRVVINDQYLEALNNTVLSAVIYTGCLTKQLTHIIWHNFVNFNAFLILLRFNKMRP